MKLVKEMIESFKEIQKYGFSSSEVVDLGYTHNYWLYKHILLYRDSAKKISLDLNAKTFEVKCITASKNDKYIFGNGICEFKSITKKLTLLECINYIRTYLYFYLIKDDAFKEIMKRYIDYENSAIDEDEIAEKIKNQFSLFALNIYSSISNYLLL